MSHFSRNHSRKGHPNGRREEAQDIAGRIRHPGAQRNRQGRLAHARGNRAHGHLRVHADGDSRAVFPRHRHGLQHDRGLAADAGLTGRTDQGFRLEGFPMARWYIIHAYSGFENKVRDAIIAEAERLGLSDAVEDVQVPTETVTEVKRGKKVQVERKFMPGYVLAKLVLTDDVYHLVKNTPKVTGFLGAGNKPQPISEREAARYFGGVEAAKSAPKREIQVDYDIGDQVKVLDGPFASFNGLVEDLDFDKRS